jgi:hypothetical protein
LFQRGIKHFLDLLRLIKTNRGDRDEIKVADYEEYNSETFDPVAKVFGNYGINSIRNAINKILDEYHYFKKAASQVDIMAHSMGGLMARGFVQQPD